MNVDIVYKKKILSWYISCLRNATDLNTTPLPPVTLVNRDKSY